MPIESFKKLWVSCHLLYPNPSQARDIFGLIVESGIEQHSSSQDQIFHGIQKLYRIYRRRIPVKSGSSNFEFTSTPMKYWKSVLQKCNKDETFIVMIIFLELLSFKDIAKIARISESKVKYLFNQSIKKLISAPVLRFEQKKEIKLKSYNTYEVSTLFVNEFFIEYTLGLTDISISEKIEAKLKNNNRYNDYKNEILKFKTEITDLTVSHHFDDFLGVYGNSTKLQNFKKIEIKQQKIIILSLVFLIIIVSGLILRPSFLKVPWEQSAHQKVVLEEIEISKKSIFEEPAVSATETVAITTSNTAQTVSLTAVVTTEKIKAESVKTNLIKAKPIQTTGVYKGFVTVTDFEQVTSIIRDHIIAVGGKKAGEVELGWIKNKNISYFHFVFPAEKRDEIVNFIQQYGKLNYKFETHPRVLPLGQNRFIIEVRKGE